MYCQTGCGRSRWTWVVSQSVTMLHRVSTSLSRKLRSSAVSAGRGAARSLRQSGLPENSSPSHQTVPASIASRSVCDIGGRTLANAEKMPSVMSLRRSAGMLSGIASSTNAAVASSVSHGGKSCPPHAAPSATASAAVQTRPDTLI